MGGMRHRSELIAALAALLIMVGVGACAQTPAAPAPAGAAFSIIVPEGSWDSLQLGYDLQPAYAKLRGLANGKRAATIGEADIESYHWSRQTLTLTASASTRLLKELASPVSPAAEFAFDHRAFVVALGTDFVYGGVFLRAISPMGVEYPVIAADSVNGRVVLTVRPRQGIALGDPGRIPDWGPIQNVAIRARFRALGKIVE
jgi:hypothetical protein